MPRPPKPSAVEALRAPLTTLMARDFNGMAEHIEAALIAALRTQGVALAKGRLTIERRFEAHDHAMTVAVRTLKRRAAKAQRLS